MVKTDLWKNRIQFVRFPPFFMMENIWWFDSCKVSAWRSRCLRMTSVDFPWLFVTVQAYFHRRHLTPRPPVLSLLPYKWNSQNCCRTDIANAFLAAVNIQIYVQTLAALILPVRIFFEGTDKKSWKNIPSVLFGKGDRCDVMDLRWWRHHIVCIICIVTCWNLAWMEVFISCK